MKTIDEVAAVRSFNRFYTARIGVLNDGLLGTTFSLAEGRVLFELARRDSTEAVELRRTLGLDAGYLSRILARLAADGLVARRRSTNDARRQSLHLTPAGRTAFRAIDERSAGEIADLLAGLEPVARRRLLGAMAAIEDLLGDGDRGGDRPGLVVLRAPLPGELGWMVQRHGALYAREYGWDERFEGLVARIVADHAAGHDPRREAAWIAETDGEPVGSVLCVPEDDTTARLRLLLVEPATRGLGVGGRLVDQCLRFATRAGYRRITLLTYDALGDARRLYERAGFSLDTDQPVEAYGRHLVEQSWSRPL